ncbi:unnamed protein product [Effrenium voratum]|nr:unnamed protein product [Effrenium voratum]
MDVATSPEAGRRLSEISDFVGDVLTPWEIQPLEVGCFSEALRQDVDVLLSEMGTVTEAQQGVIRVLQESLVGRRLRICPEAPLMPSYRYEDNSLVPVSKELPPPYEVHILSIELVGSQGQMTQVPGSDLDAVALLDFAFAKDFEAVKEDFMIHGHEALRNAMIGWLRQNPKVGLRDEAERLHKSRVECTIENMEVDVLQAMLPHHLTVDDMRMQKPGVWIKAYSLNVRKTRWVAAQHQIVRDAARLMKLWARQVREEEAKEMDDEELHPKINTYALTLLLAALHLSAASNFSLELCARAWRVLASLRVDLLAVVTFDRNFSARLSRGPRFHPELLMALNFQGIELYGLMVEDIVQVDRFYPCGTLPTWKLATFASSALMQLASAQTWGQLLAQHPPAGVQEELRRFSSSMEAHWSFFRGLAAARCPNGHQLDLGVLGMSLECDECQLRGDGMHMLGCRQCDFDLCRACATAVRMTCSQFPVPASLEQLLNAKGAMWHG